MLHVRHLVRARDLLLLWLRGALIVNARWPPVWLSLTCVRAAFLYLYLYLRHDCARADVVPRRA